MSALNDRRVVVGRDQCKSIDGRPVADPQVDANGGDLRTPLGEWRLFEVRWMLRPQGYKRVDRMVTSWQMKCEVRWCGR